MIGLFKDNTGTTEYSQGTGNTPITASVTLPTDADTPVATTEDVFVWCNDDTGTIAGYTNIVLEMATEETGINWELSLDGETAWGESIAIADQDVSVSSQSVQVYARCTVASGKATASYVAADFKLSYKETPE